MGFIKLQKCHCDLAELNFFAGLRYIITLSSSGEFGYTISSGSTLFELVFVLGLKQVPCTVFTLNVGTPELFTMPV